MASKTTHCPKCAYLMRLKADQVSSNGQKLLCPACMHQFTAYVFPAFHQDITPGAKGEKVTDQETASCFYHPDKKAVIHCDMCGRFLCGLCDLEIDSRHLCPPCLENGPRKQQLPALDQDRLLYDNVALALAIFPAFTIWTTIITAPVTIGIIIRYWKRQISLLPRSRIRFIIAFTVAVLEIFAWLGFVVMIV